MLLELPEKAKPSGVVSKPKDHRPKLETAWLEEQAGQPMLLASDSYKLLLLPVDVKGDVEPTHISVSALKAIEKTGRGEIGEYVESLDKQGNSNGVLFRKPEGERPQHADLKWPKGPSKKNRLTLALNAQLLFELAQGLGAPHKGSVKLTIDLAEVKDTPEGSVYERPIVVEPTRGEGRGLLMPIRVVA